MQKVRSLFYRLRGKDPLTYRRGKLFSGARTVKQRIKKLRIVAPLKARMAFWRLMGSPMDYLWHPTPRREPRLVRTIKKNIAEETVSEMSFVPKVVRIGLMCIDAEREEAKVAEEIATMPEKYRANNMIKIDELSPRWQKLFHRQSVLESQINDLRNQLGGHFYRTYLKIATRRSTKWTFNQMGVSRKKQEELIIPISGMIQSLYEAEVPVETLHNELKKLLRSERKVLTFLKIFEQTQERLKISYSDINTASILEKVTAHA